MQKINNNTKSKLSKEKTNSKKGEISIRDKKNGKEARTTLQLGYKGIKNPRIECYGENEEKAISKIKEIELSVLIELKNFLLLTNNNYLAPEYSKDLEEFNKKIEKLVKQKNFSIPKNFTSSSNRYTLSDGTEVECTYPISLFVYKMIKKKKKQSEIVTTKKRKKLSPKTVTNYWDTAKAQVLPYLGNKDAKTITTEELQEYFDNLDYKEKYLKDIRLVLKMSFDEAIKEKIRPDNPASNIEIGSTKDILGIEIEHLNQDEQEIWLDCFEKDKRQWAYLFEAMLLTGARPEEACGLKWNAIDFEKDIIHICNAFKEIALYDENMKIIGHQMCDGDLKTPESLRDIPMHPRLKRLLLMIKSDRMIELYSQGKEWDENDYIFLNENGAPYVSERLSNKMPKFIKKYKLKHLTVYGLRHSFATLCSTLGMPPEVLHVLMGHSDFDTTRKYYIHISEERKRYEMIKLYRQQTTEPKIKQLIEETDLYFNKIISLRIQDFKPENTLAS